jgi:hypothetical protein
MRTTNSIICRPGRHPIEDAAPIERELQPGRGRSVVNVAPGVI